MAFSPSSNPTLGSERAAEQPCVSSTRHARAVTVHANRHPVLPVYPVTDDCVGFLHTLPCITYTKDALLALDIPTTLSPDVCDRLRSLSIHRRFGLPCIPRTTRKRPYRAGKRKTKGRRIPVFTGRTTLNQQRRLTSSDPDNLIRVTDPSVRDTEHNNLCVALFNAQSVGSAKDTSKRTEIANFIVDHSVDMLFVTETWLKPVGDEAKCAQLAPPGYTAKSFPRSSRGGGIVVVYRDSLSRFLAWTTNFTFVHTSYELIRATLCLPQRTIQFCCVYRPPPNLKNKLTIKMFFDQFPDLLDYCNTLPGQCVILGDFNFHYDRPNHSSTKTVNSLFEMFDLQQAVSSPTQISGHTLDWFIHKPSDNLLMSIDVTHAIVSDHFCVVSHLNVSVPPAPPVYVMKRDIKGIDREAFKADVRTALAQLPDPCAHDLESALRGALDRHAPATRCKVSSRRTSPWFNSVSAELKQAKRERRRAERRWLSTGLTIHKQMYNIAKNKVTTIVDLAKSNYYSSRIEQSKSCKQLFKITNELAARKNEPAMPTNVPPTELSQVFADFFQNKIQKLRNSLDSLPNSDVDVTDKSASPTFSFSSFQHVSDDDVKKVILKCTPKSCELDALPTTLLLEILDEILPAITYVINQSLSSGTFPSCFKSAIIKPLLKKPNLDRNELKNYRPVSNLSFLSKVTEKIVLSQLSTYLTSHNLFSPVQSAYRPFHSTETALLKITNDLLCALDAGDLSVLALLDLSAAFDTIDHDILLRRLEHVFGVRDVALSWFRSYLAGRSQVVVIDSGSADQPSKSSPSPLQYGVPQGSVLGPLLFVLYTQPLDNIFDRHSISHHSFADDTQMQKSGPLSELETVISDIQACISEVKYWMRANKLQLNDEKTEVLLVKSSRLSLHDTTPSSIRIGQTHVPFTAHAKNLGVTLSSDMSMDKHVANICRSAYIELRRISSIRHFLTTDATKTLVSAFVLSRLDYCNSLLAGVPQYLLKKLQQVQNSAARLILKRRKRDRPQPLLTQLHWLPIKSRIDYKLSTFCFNAFTTSCPVYLSDLIPAYTSVRHLRSSADSRLLKTPNTRTKTFGERSFSFAAPKIWKKLPYELRHSESVTTFKKNLKTHLFKSC